jgi:hypothetical protein
MKKRSKTQTISIILFAHNITGIVVFAANRTSLLWPPRTTNIHPQQDELLLDKPQSVVHLLILPLYLHSLLVPINRLLSVPSPP